jgi:hypothetical protein
MLESIENAEHLLGARIVESVHCVVTKDVWVRRKRTWRERLRRRWRVTHKPVKEVREVPNPDCVYMANENVIVCHPTVAEQVKKELAGLRTGT